MDRTQLRRRWRAAWYIYARLANKTNTYLQLPQKEWHDCQRGLARLAHANSAGRLISLRWLEPDLSRQLRFLIAQLNTLASEVSSICLPPRLATTAEIFHDLAALKTEFETVELDLKQKLLSVTTEPLELADQYLGRMALSQCKSYQVQCLRSWRRNMFRGFCMSL